MRRLRSDRLGISEIVGTLMLVLIVVTAATSLALFVASYQKQLQAERQVTQQRGLESLTIIRASPTLAPGGANWSVLNFTLASLYINPSTVTEIMINNNPLKQFTAWRLDLTTGQFVSVSVGAGGQLALAPRDQVSILVNFTVGSPSYSFYNVSFALPASAYIKIDAVTTLQNDFDRVFIPPTAIALVTPLQSWNGSGFVTVPVLDGGSSFQPGNATLVSWAWAISPDNRTLSGERAVATFDPIFSTHNITLVVTNSDGLLGAETIHYP